MRARRNGDVLITSTSLPPPQPPHGTRSRYQGAGCACTPCRAAEAAYRATLRRQHLTGHAPLGCPVSAGPTWRQIRSLRVEGFSVGEIARRLGVPRLRLHTDKVSLRRFLQVRALYRQMMIENPEKESNASRR